MTARGIWPVFSLAAFFMAGCQPGTDETANFADQDTAPTIPVETATPGRGDIFAVYEQHADALLIPVEALINEDNQVAVYVVEDGAAVRRIIQTGIRSGDEIEVLSGLHEHEQIVVTGQGSLRDGSRVLASNNIEGPVTG